MVKNKKSIWYDWNSGSGFELMEHAAVDSLQAAVIEEAAILEIKTLESRACSCKGRKKVIAVV